MAKEYPRPELYSIVSTGDPAEDARQLDAIVRREKRLAEGLCANGCGPMRRVPAATVPHPVTGKPFLVRAHEECSACGFAYYD